VIQDDGTLLVTETLTYDFDGAFSGAYRDIPLRQGEAITDVTVRDEATTYQLGGCTDLGCTSPPGGVEQQNDLVRIVWHHSSFSERRTFQVSYTMTGLTVAYDDVVDVNLQVWGDQWSVGLDRLEARMTLPAVGEPGDHSRGEPDVARGQQRPRVSVGRAEDRFPTGHARFHRRGHRGGRRWAGPHHRRGG
jgi:hypothetical protein